MKKTKCKICGEDAMPIYFRRKVDSEEKKGLQFFRAGTWCLNPNCDVIQTDNGLYRKVPPDPIKLAKAQELRERKENEDLMSVMNEMLKNDPGFKEL